MNLRDPRPRRRRGVHNLMLIPTDDDRRALERVATLLDDIGQEMMEHRGHDCGLFNVDQAKDLALSTLVIESIVEAYDEINGKEDMLATAKIEGFHA